MVTSEVHSCSPKWPVGSQHGCTRNVRSNLKQSTSIRTVLRSAAERSTLVRASLALHTPRRSPLGPTAPPGMCQARTRASGGSIGGGGGPPIGYDTGATDSRGQVGAMPSERLEAAWMESADRSEEEGLKGWCAKQFFEVQPLHLMAEEAFMPASEAGMIDEC